MAAKYWRRAYLQGIPNFSQPLSQSLLVFSSTLTGIANIGSGWSLVRGLFWWDFYVQAAPMAPSTSVEVGWWDYMQVVSGAWFTSVPALPSPGPTPLTDINESPEWYHWDPLLPTLPYYENTNPYLDVHFRNENAPLEIGSKRASNVSDENGLFLAYEINDPSGLVNTATSSGVYALGYTIYASCLFDGL